MYYTSISDFIVHNEETGHLQKKKQKRNKTQHKYIHVFIEGPCRTEHSYMYSVVALTYIPSSIQVIPVDHTSTCRQEREGEREEVKDMMLIISSQLCKTQLWTTTVYCTLNYLGVVFPLELT